MNPPIRVLVVDDHPVVRTGVRGMLDSHADFDVVGEACDGEEAIAQVDVLEPDVVLMDLRLPGVDGAEATRRIRAAHPDVQVLVLTTYDTDDDIVRAVEAGPSATCSRTHPVRSCSGGYTPRRGASRCWRRRLYPV